MYVGCTAFAPWKRLCIRNTTFACKRIIAYVYDLCARGNLCVWCTSFARKWLIAYVVRLLRLRRLIAYVVRLFCAWGNLYFRIWPSNRAMTLIVWIVRSLKSCGSVQLCDDWDSVMTDGHWRILWVRPIVRWLGLCDDFDLNRPITVRSCDESKYLNRSITVRSCDDSKDLTRLITVRSCDDSKDYNRSITVRSCDDFNRPTSVW